MTLTLGSGPLASNPVGDVNFDLTGAPRHRILFEDFPRRMRAIVGERTVLDSSRGKLLHESNIHPVYYAPIGDFDSELLVDSEATSHCPFKGDAAYWSLEVDGARIDDAVWYYPQPTAEAPWLEGYAALYWERADLWLQEDEPVHGALRDPYHRVDVYESSRPVRVTLNGTVIAQSDRPKMLFETGLPPRPYLLRSDVAAGVLAPSDSTSWCPYKGGATYWNITTAERTLADGAWSYESPLPEALKAEGHVSIDGEGIETILG